MSQPEIPSPSGEPAARPEQLPPPPGDAAADGDRPQQAVDGEEQALESHEVIELQSFSVKKAWIEEKTKVRRALCGWSSAQSDVYFLSFSSSFLRSTSSSAWTLFGPPRRKYPVYLRARSCRNG